MIKKIISFIETRINNILIKKTIFQAGFIIVDGIVTVANPLNAELLSRHQAYYQSLYDSIGKNKNVVSSESATEY